MSSVNRSYEVKGCTTCDFAQARFQFILRSVAAAPAEIAATQTKRYFFDRSRTTNM